MQVHKRKQPKQPATAAPMQTVGVKIPEWMRQELDKEVANVIKSNPGRRYTISDAIRERLFNTLKNTLKST